MDAGSGHRATRAKSIACGAELSRRRVSSQSTQGPLLSAAAERRLLQATQGAHAIASSNRARVGSRLTENFEDRKRRLQEECDRRLVRAGLEPASQTAKTVRDRLSYQPQSHFASREEDSPAMASPRLSIQSRRIVTEQENRVAESQSSPRASQLGSTSPLVKTASPRGAKPSGSSSLGQVPSLQARSSRSSSLRSSLLQSSVPSPSTSSSRSRSASIKTAKNNSRGSTLRTAVHERCDEAVSRPEQSVASAPAPVPSTASITLIPESCSKPASRLEQVSKEAQSTSKISTTTFSPRETAPRGPNAEKTNETAVAGLASGSSRLGADGRQARSLVEKMPQRVIESAKRDSKVTVNALSPSAAVTDARLSQEAGTKTLQRADVVAEEKEDGFQANDDASPSIEIFITKEESACDLKSNEVLSPEAEEKGDDVTDRIAEAGMKQDEKGDEGENGQKEEEESEEEGSFRSLEGATQTGGPIDEATLASLQKSLSQDTPVREFRSTSAPSAPADIHPSGQRSSSVVETARRSDAVGDQSSAAPQRQQESLLGRVLSHGIHLALTQDRLQPQRDTSPEDFTQVVQHQPYLELSSRRTFQFRLSDWCPVVFRNLRQQQDIQEDDYLTSMCGEALRGGAQGSGKSGAIFFKSADQKFVVKEVRRSERETLLRILPSMVEHVTSYPHSYLPRFLGLYTVDAIPDVLPQSMTIVVMTNVLEFPPKQTSLQLNEVYDLKGSVHNRFTCSPNKALHAGATPPLGRKSSVDGTPSATKRLSLQHSFSSPSSVCSTPSTIGKAGVTSLSRQNSVLSSGGAMQAAGSTFSTPTFQTRRGSTGTTPSGSKPFVLKDLNLRSRFALGPKRKALLVSQLQHDVEWLERHNLMDYSFLVGVASDDKLDGSPFMGSASQIVQQQQMPLDSLDSPSGIPFPALASSPGPSELSSCRTSEGFEAFQHAEEEEEAHSELGAILRRNRLQRQETASLLPEGSTVQVQLIGHGKAKRSRESSTIFRQSCTLYSFLVTREPGPPSLGVGAGVESVDNPEKLRAAESQPTATSESKPDIQWIVFRRYKDFEKLQKGLQDELKSANSALRLPALPRKQLIGFMEPDFVRRRQQELTQWIQSILSLVNHRVDSPVLHEFLTNKANRCPPKWQADRSLQQMVQRRISSPVVMDPASRRSLSLSRASHASRPGRRSSSGRKSLGRGCSKNGASRTVNTGLSGSNPSGPRASTSPPSQTPMTPQRPRATSEASALSPELSQIFEPNSKFCLPLWATLGGPKHQGFDATRTSNATGRKYPVKLFVGIIDILQEFNLSKKLESVFKGLTQHADGISAVDPERYGERFLGFVDEFVFE